MQSCPRPTVAWYLPVVFLSFVAAAVTPVRAQDAETAPLTTPQAAAQPGPGGGPLRQLSVDDAVKLALEQNLGIQTQRLDPQIQDFSVAQARSFWAPQFTTGVQRQSSNQPATSAFNPQYDSATTGGSIGFNQLLPWGGSYTASWVNQRLVTSNAAAFFSPQLNSNVQFNYTQPLLQNFSIDQIRQQVQISRKLRDLSDIQLQSVIVGTVRSVKNAYWDLAYAINNLAAQQESLKLAQQSLKDNQKRVQIGTMAPIDIVQAEAEVASNEQNVIVAEAAIKTAEDRLRALILDPATPDFWSIELQPTDTAPFQEQAIDVEAAVSNALNRRADIASAKNSLAQSDVNIRYFRNQILPAVNAQVNYGLVGLGGSELSPITSLEQITGGIPRSIVLQRSFGSVLNDVFTNAYPTWTVGVQIGYPIGASTARANLARSKLQYEQAQVQIKNLELQVATQVRLAARQVRTNEQRVKSARASRALQEKKLEAEEKKFAAGMSTSFFVFQAQRDLASARTIEIQAISDYNKSLVDFEAVQLVSISGPTGSVVVAGTGAVQTGNNAIVRQQ